MQKTRLKKIKRSDKEHSGPTASIIDAAILRCWEFEATRWQEQKAYFRGSHAVASSIDKTQSEIINSVKESMERKYSNGNTWINLYPLWFKKNLETYVDSRLEALEDDGFISNSKAGIWTMISNAIEETEWDLLRLVSEKMLPHKQLNIPELLRPRN